LIKALFVVLLLGFCLSGVVGMLLWLFPSKEEPPPTIVFRNGFGHPGHPNFVGVTNFASGMDQLMGDFVKAQQNIVTQMQAQTPAMLNASTQMVGQMAGVANTLQQSLQNMAQQLQAQQQNLSGVADAEQTTGTNSVKVREMEREVLRVKLRQAQETLGLAEKRFAVGRLSSGDLQAARDEVEVLQAELGGDPVQVARVRLAAAQRILQLTEKRFQAGAISPDEYQAAKNAVELRQAELRLAESRHGAASTIVPQAQQTTNAISQP
jgi:hypothetical protein